MIKITVTYRDKIARTIIWNEDKKVLIIETDDGVKRTIEGCYSFDDAMIVFHKTNSAPDIKTPIPPRVVLPPAE